MTDIFLGGKSHMSGWNVIRFPVKNAGLSLPGTKLTAQENCMVLCVSTGNIVAALWGRVDYRSRYHAQVVRNSRTDI